MEMICLATSPGWDKAEELFTARLYSEVPEFAELLAFDYKANQQGMWWLWQANRMPWVSQNVDAIKELANGAKYVFPTNQVMCLITLPPTSDF